MCDTGARGGAVRSSDQRPGKQPAPHSSKNKSKIQEKNKQMTDTQNATAEDLELFDDATEEFPGKEDLKDRLVAIWVTGRHGTRIGKAPGSKPYPWYETVTLVLDDGPAWDGYKIVDGERKPMLIESVTEHGPQRLDGFQYAQTGMTKRLEQRVHLSIALPAVGKEVKDQPKSFKPMLGRINSRKNSQAGFNASWSISEPTDGDRAKARAQAALILQISAELEKAGQPTDEDAFE